MQTKEGKRGGGVAKKVVNIVADVIVAVILVFVLIVTIAAIRSSGKGYTELFGKALVSVQTDSMVGEGADNFKAGDLLQIDVLKDDEKKSLKAGDVISFYDPTIRVGEVEVNSHRIIGVSEMDGVIYYQTKGDNNDTQDNFLVPDTAVIGVVSGKIENLGSAIDWVRSPTGFFVCIVLPSFLIVAYFAFNLIRTIVKSKKIDAEAERERIRQELLAEIQAQDAPNGDDSPDGGARKE